MSYNQDQQNINPSNEEKFEVKKPVSKAKKKKVDKFTEITNKIILKEGMTIKEFEKQAIQQERQKLYDKFVSENIEALL